MVYTVLDQEGLVEAMFRSKAEAHDYARRSGGLVKRMKLRDANESYEEGVQRANERMERL